MHVFLHVFLSFLFLFQNSRKQHSETALPVQVAGSKPRGSHSGRGQPLPAKFLQSLAACR